MQARDCLIRLRPRLAGEGLTRPLQLRQLEAVHLPTAESRKLEIANCIQTGIEFDRIGRSVVYWLYREHPYETLNPVVSTELVRCRPTRCCICLARSAPGSSVASRGSRAI